MALQEERRQGTERIKRYVVVIDAARCTGCGACLETCPTGALFLVEGKATLDEALCSGCGACVSVCLGDAITLIARQEPEVMGIRLPAVRPEPEVIRINTQTAPVPFRSRAMPVVGAAIAWAGREILPRLADLLLDRLDRQATSRQVVRAELGRDSAHRGGEGRGRQQRRRQRGGRA